MSAKKTTKRITRTVGIELLYFNFITNSPLPSRKFVKNVFQGVSARNPPLFFT